MSSDKVRKPDHYGAMCWVNAGFTNGEPDSFFAQEFVHIECKDVIRALGLNYYVGNVLKYIWRAGKKDQKTLVEDLKKAREYLNIEISHIERENRLSEGRGFSASARNLDPRDIMDRAGM